MAPDSAYGAVTPPAADSAIWVRHGNDFEVVDTVEIALVARVEGQVV